jgi:hypothetical protein
MNFNYQIMINIILKRESVTANLDPFPVDFFSLGAIKYLDCSTRSGG